MNTRFSRTAIASVALMRIRGIGRRAAVRLVDAPILNDDDQLELLDRAARNKIDAIQLREELKVAEDQLDRSAEAGISSIAYHDADFPTRLKDIPDPPAVVFVKGNPTSLTSKDALAVVGTREPTDYGAKVAERLAASASLMGFSIVSGLAHGCDTFAHKGCVEAGGVGVAVLAHGLDKVYPAANKDLAQKLIERGGGLMSEYPLGMSPIRKAFAERDRLQSGLSDCVLVIETDIKGGTMHTVRFARQQSRHLACIDHPTALHREPKVQGNRQLIADRWADPIANSEALATLLQKLKARTGPEAAKPDPNSATQLSMDF